MLRSILICLFPVPLLAQAAIWPDNFGDFVKTSSMPVSITDADLWEEYGFDEGEEAVYTLNGQGQSFTAAAIRLRDSTGAMAAFQWQRPPGAHPSELGRLAVEYSDTLLLAFGNYVFRFEGRTPDIAELAALLHRLPRLDQSPLPGFIEYLPRQNLAPNSERFILGPVSLQRFEPRIPPSVAAFHYGTEAQLGLFQSSGGPAGLIIFSYPTPHIARERLAEFQKLPGAMAKRTGPIIAVTLSPPDRDEAERLLARVNYRASMTWSEFIPSARDNLGDLLITIFILIGLLFAAAIIFGLAFGGFRTVLSRWLGRPHVEEPMIRLHIEDR